MTNMNDADELRSLRNKLHAIEYKQKYKRCVIPAEPGFEVAIPLISHDGMPSDVELKPVVGWVIIYKPEAWDDDHEQTVQFAEPITVEILGKYYAIKMPNGDFILPHDQTIRHGKDARANLIDAFRETYRIDKLASKTTGIGT
jgi:hypothetical protein